MKGKKLILIISQLLKYLLYVNIILGGGVIGFQIINLFVPEKSLAASYLGKFIFEIEAVNINSGNGTVAAFIESVSGNAALALNTQWHAGFVLLFSLCAVLVSLTFNYLFYQIFKELNASVKQGTPYTTQISVYLKRVAVFSVAVFVVGSILSVLKILIVKPLVFNNFVARPVFDNQLLNFLWFGLSFFILNEIYKVGVVLKKEQELTI